MLQHLKKYGLGFFLALSAVQPVQAVNQVTVTEVTPSVMARLRPGDWAELRVGTVLTAGYEISSDPDGQVKLAFQDNSVVVVRPTTQIKIGTFFTKGGLVRT